MTVSEFAIHIYHLGIIKDRVKVIQDTEVIYNDRMEFLRYASDYDPKMKWVDKLVKKVEMEADNMDIPLDEDGEPAWNPGYTTVIYI